MTIIDGSQGTARQLRRQLQARGWLTRRTRPGDRDLSEQRPGKDRAEQNFVPTLRYKGRCIPLKKCLIVSLMLLSLLTLAACGTTQGDTTDTADTTDSSQTAADTTQDAQDNAQNDAQGDTQENAQNDTQEGRKNDGKIDSKTDGKIKPLPDALDLNRLTSGTVAASFDASSLKEVDGQLQLSFTVYNYEKFDAADISGLKAGDVSSSAAGR